MSLTIDFMDETGQFPEQFISQLEELLHFAAEKEYIKDLSEVSVTIVTNERIQEINRDYRGIDQPTDVISFALEEMVEDELEIQVEGMPRVLGDIIISLPKAIEQAKTYGHSLERELGFLAVHGFLHLLGYDHMNDADEKIMFARQREILDEFGLQR